MLRETISLQTNARCDFIPITEKVQAALSKIGVSNGICTVYVPHTTAGVFINEGYDPAVMRDLQDSLEKQVPWEDGYAHGEGNSAAHIKAVLVGNSQQVIVENGHLVLGQWEEIFFADFDGPRTRKIYVTFLVSND